MTALLARLATICADHRLREKILVVPSLAIGHQIADALAHGGTPWVNLRVETMRSLADAVAGFALAKEGVTVLSRAQALALVERACDEVLDTGSYFAAVADRPGLHRAIQKSIDDLRHAAIDPSKITTPAVEDRRKARDIVRILEAYEKELIKQRYVDRFGVLARAISMLEGGASRPWGKDTVWIAVEDVELTAAEKRLLTLVAGDYETLNGGGDAVPSLQSIDFRRAIGEENELRGAFRALLESGTPFDSAEIVYTARDPYLPLAYELAAEYEIPCTFAEGIAAHFTRPGQACLAFLRWLGDGWHAADLQSAARSGAFASPGFARILRRARIGWGRDRYLERLDMLLAERVRNVEQAAAQDASDGSRRAAEESRAAVADARKVVVDLLKMTEAVAEGDRTNVPAAARAASTFVARFAHIRNEIDAMAREGLGRMLDELSVLGGEASRSEVSARLSEAVRNLHVSASNPRPGFLHVAPIRAGAWSARSRLFLVGLDESKHPGSGLQDPVILDVEREAIGIPIVGDRPQRSMEQFHRLLGRASNRLVTLSYASLALADRRERFPSRALLAMYRATNGRPDATYEEVGSSIARAGFIDRVSISGSEWWLWRRFADGEADIGAAVLEAYPGLMAGARAEAARDSDEITKWDGRIEGSRQDLDPRLNGRVYSASQIEGMAGCPYRHFLQRILRIRPLDDLAWEQDTWLEANEFGSLVHEMLESTMKELCEGGRKPSMAFLPRMQEIASDALQRYRDAIPPPSEAAYENRRQELFDSCEVFLRTEEEACRSVTPMYFEVPFGAGDGEGDEPSLAISGPFTLPLGGGASVKLRGRIDRVDHDETHDEWHVWDYKSGGTYAFDRGGVLSCGTKIQHAIYARAVEAMLKEKGMSGRVTRSGYLFPTTKGRGARLLRECSDGDLSSALNSLFDVIATGFFPHGNVDACRFCDFKAVCGGEELASKRMANKFAKNANEPAVGAWLALQDVK
jgi:ATP-dependent helicase/nuclease subunit B